jgi:hypothetical protein
VQADMTMIGSGSDAGSLARERRLRSHIVSVELMRELVTRASTQKSSSMSGISRPAVRGGLVLYLDFDGVLHPEDVGGFKGEVQHRVQWMGVEG